MYAAISRLLDGVAIRMACASVEETTAVFHHGAEARSLLEQPDYFEPATRVPEVTRHGRTRLSFRSSHLTPWAENNQVWGRLYRAGGGERWRERPAVVLLHGWNGEWQYALQFPYLAWRLRRRGLNVGTLELPYHGRRRPTQRGAVRNFVSGDLYRMVEAAHQSLADVRAFCSWLKGEGVARIGLWGISLGGWLTGLLVCQDLGLRCAALVTPIVRMDRAIEELPFFRRVKQSLEAAPMDLGRFSLREQTPQVARNRLLLVAGSHDLFSPMGAVVDLWQAWRQPTLWRLNHGHISLLFSFGALDRVVGWFEGQLGD